MNKTLMLLLGCSALAGIPSSGIAAADRPTDDPILRGFQTPPEDAKPHTLYHWMNGHISAEGVTRDLSAMKEAGLGAFMLWNTSEGTPPGPVDYMSDEWWKLLGFTASEAGRLGLKMGIFNCAGWATCGGPWITPDRAMQEVVWTERQVSGGTEFNEVLETPLPVLGIERDMGGDPEANKRYFTSRESMRGWYRDLVVWAFPTPRGEHTGQPFRLDHWRDKAGYAKYIDYHPDLRQAAPEDCLDPRSMVNLTAQLGPDGRLKWKVPAGNWTILRIGYQPTGRLNHPTPPGGRGLEVDKMSAAAIDYHWDHSLAKILQVANAQAPGVLYNVHLDSYEAGHQNWTARFAEEFRTRCGYDLTAYLPALTGRIVGNVDTTERFLWDFRKTIGDLITENYYGRFHELCAQNHVLLSIEPYGAFGNTDDFAVAGIADLPMGEFWGMMPAKYHHASSKMVASVTHTYGLALANAEAFTGDPSKIFQTSPYSLKTQGDYFFCQGTTRFSFHTFVHNPYPVKPGFALGSFGSRIDRNNTWWPYAKPWFEYLTRCQYLLGQGHFIADLLYYSGEDAPQAAKPREKLNPQPPDGYDYDFCNVEILSRLKVRDGRLVLPTGMTYRALVLPPRNRMSLGVLREIEALVAAGATIVGPKPTQIAGVDARHEQAAMQQLADRMWGACDGHSVTSNGYKAGRVVWGEPLTRVLQVAPDFTYTLKSQGTYGATEYWGNGVEYIHRHLDDGRELYFVSNQHYERKVIEATFRTAGLIPEFWHADTGKIEAVRRYRAAGSAATVIDLDLDPAGSVFVVFRRPLPNETVSGEMPPAPAAGPVAIAVEGPWKLAFPDGRGAPAEIELPRLISWTQDSRFDVQHYSGVGRYRTDFTVPAERLHSGGRLILDLGDVKVIARAWLNGRDLGILWKAPFAADVTDALQPGSNHLEVEVANLWVNRVLGDQAYPDDLPWTDKTGTRLPGKGLAYVPDWVKDAGPRPEPRRKTFTAWLWPGLKLGKMPLFPSGLLGPVEIVTAPEAETR